MFVPRIAAREAYLSAYHAAEALIHDRTGKVAKTHRVVGSEFVRLPRGDERVDRRVFEFPAQAYELKAIADYGTGSEAIIMAETAREAIETAETFFRLIAEMLGADDEGS